MPGGTEAADLSPAVASWENEGGATARLKPDGNTGWFVPPLVIPFLLAAFMAVRIAFLAFES